MGETDRRPPSGERLGKAFLAIVRFIFGALAGLLIFFWLIIWVIPRPGQWPGYYTTLLISCVTVCALLAGVFGDAFFEWIKDKWFKWFDVFG